jgi:hypothetical protein
MMLMIQHLVGALVTLTVVLAMAIDVATFRIPNAFPGTLVLLFYCGAVVSSHPVDWLGHMGAGFLVLALAAACFAFGYLGGGDAKLAEGASARRGGSLWPGHRRGGADIDGDIRQLRGAMNLSLRPSSRATATSRANSRGGRRHAA